jgi:hypothetical protein
MLLIGSWGCEKNSVDSRGLSWHRFCCRFLEQESSVYMREKTLLPSGVERRTREKTLEQEILLYNLRVLLYRGPGR